MTSPRDPRSAVRAEPAFSSTRPGQSRRNSAGWVPLTKATRNLVGSAHQLRGAFHRGDPAAPARHRGPEE